MNEVSIISAVVAEATLDFAVVVVVATSDSTSTFNNDKIADEFIVTTIGRGGWRSGGRGEGMVEVTAVISFRRHCGRRRHRPSSSSSSSVDAP